jgi:hypothetical protein
MGTTDHLDILVRQNDGDYIWLEAANDLEAAKARLQELSANNPGEYFIFDQRTQQVVANTGRRAANT